MMSSTLCVFYSVSSLKQQSVDRYVAPLKHIILIQSQPVFAHKLLLNDACLAERQHINVIVFGLTRSKVEPMNYHTQDKDGNHYSIDAVTYKGPTI